MEKQINILKAKLVTPKGKNKEGWHLEAHWEETIAGKTAKDSRECPINPHPDLITAFQRLARHVAALTDQYNDEGQIDSLNVEARGYSLSGEDEKEGIIITGVRKISGNRTIVLNTPLLKEKCRDKIIEAGGEQREDNDLIYDFKESPADFIKKQSRNKNKYLQFAEA